VHSSEAGGAYGAAMVAGVGCGIWATPAEAMETIRTTSETGPNRQNAGTYRRLYGAYAKMYPALKWYFEGTP